MACFLKRCTSSGTLRTLCKPEASSRWLHRGWTRPGRISSPVAGRLQMSGGGINFLRALHVPFCSCITMT
jgi:hypothetical protein